MLALTLVTMMLVQAPQTPPAMKAWVDQEGDPSRPDSYVVNVARAEPKGGVGVCQGAGL